MTRLGPFSPPKGELKQEIVREDDISRVGCVNGFSRHSASFMKAARQGYANSPFDAPVDAAS